MTRGPDRLAEPSRLLEMICEESFTHEQMRRLERILLADPEAQESSIKYVYRQVDLLRGLGGSMPATGTPARGRPSCVDAVGSARSAGRSVERRPWLPWTIARACGIAALNCRSAASPIAVFQP